MTTFKVAIPDGRKRPDSFYEQVAARWTILTITRPTARPAHVLAEANDVPVTTVHRWIKEARRRGILGPGQRGSGHPCRLCGQPMDDATLTRYRTRHRKWRVE